jgi:glycosyltransferase involved in cell wall biosynthesis
VTPPAGRELAVDIIVTNYNYARFLPVALDSACRQTHPRVKVIAVDDGSTDVSRSVLARYADRVEVILKDRGGQASAVNAGVERCQGDILLFLDADDVLRPFAAERVAAAFASDPKLAKVQFRMAVVDAAGRDTGTTKPSGHLQPPTGDVSQAELAYPFDLPWLPGGGTAFRTELLRRILPIPESDYPGWGADWYLVHLAALLGTAAALDEVCADYRVHGSNGYELDRSDLDLLHIRAGIGYAAVTTRHLERLADGLGMSRPTPILSVSDLANRLISLKLEPDLHPNSADRSLPLLWKAARALNRRFDVTWPMKALFVAWFLAMTVAPRRLAVQLAELLVFPDRRASLNRLLGRLQRRSDDQRLANLT